MYCSKCGTQNNEGYKFCIKCGNSLNSTSAEASTVVEENILEQNVSTNVEQPVISKQQLVEPVPQVQQQVAPVEPSVNAPQSSITNNNSFNFFKYIISFILKPFETYKKEEQNLSNTKTGLILGSIVAGAMMIINLLVSMISAIFVKTMDYSTFQYKTKIDFSGLENLDYLNLIGKNLLIYICVIAVIAGVYYLASLVVKKSINFIKTLSISSSAIIPYAIMSMLVSPILGKIWAPLSIVATIVGAVYSIIIFVMLISDNINFDKKDLNAYFHLACMSILGTAGYYAYMNIITSGIASEFSDYLNMFN